MVLERPVPSETVDDFLRNYTGVIDEDLARVIMRQAVFAAQTCCQRGVFHRDIKPENLLINPETLQVKLIDFGCGAFLNSKGYTYFSGIYDFSKSKIRSTVVNQLASNYFLDNNE